MNTLKIFLWSWDFFHYWSKYMFLFIYKIYNYYYANNTWLNLSIIYFN